MITYYKRTLQDKKISKVSEFTAGIWINVVDPTSSEIEFLVKKYRREAYFHARTILGNTEDAADACQESFTKAFLAIPKLTQMDAFYPWFYRILRNCCLNMIRKKKSADKYKTETRHHMALVDHDTNPSATLEKKEDKRFIWDVLKKLSPEFREILVLKYLQDFCYAEISEYLGIPRGTVMSRLYYARKAFRDQYLLLNQSAEKSRREVAI